jgi:hypothetical protein
VTTRLEVIEGDRPAASLDRSHPDKTMVAPLGRCLALTGTVVATEYEALRLTEKQAYKKTGQTKPPRESREKKPLTKKVKEMIGASR